MKKMAVVLFLLNLLSNSLLAKNTEGENNQLVKTIGQTIFYVDHNKKIAYSEIKIGIKKYRKVLPYNIISKWI